MESDLKRFPLTVDLQKRLCLKALLCSEEHSQPPEFTIHRAQVEIIQTSQLSSPELSFMREWEGLES